MGMSYLTARHSVVEKRGKRLGVGITGGAARCGVVWWGLVWCGVVD